jgi:hypothetical protein
MRRAVPLEDRQRWLRERNSGPAGRVDDQGNVLDFAQRHYTVAQVADRWNLSHDAVRRLFEEEPGVLVLGGNPSRGRRPYTTLRIPESVVERVYRKRLSR